MHLVTIEIFHTRWLALLVAVLLAACSNKPAAPVKDTPPAANAKAPAHKDPEAERLRTAKINAELERARREQARGDGQRYGYRLAGDAQDVATRMSAVSRRGPDKPDIKTRPRTKQVTFDSKGSINAKAVGAAFTRHRTLLQNCYERGLKRNPSLRGKVGLTVNIKRDGRVGFVRVSKNTLRDPAVITCMTKRVKRFKFPSPEGGGVTVAKTFSFTPQT